MKYTAIILLAGLLAVVACKEQDEKVDVPALHQNVPPELVAADPECFLKVVGRDSIIFQMEHDGDSVHGVFNWKPYEKDTKLSNFKGTLINGKGKAIAQVSAEGMNTNEELEFSVSNNTVSVKYGEMEQQKDGIWHYKSGTQTSTQILTKVDCPH